MTIQTMLLLFGGVLLLIAIIGGGFEVRELKIPKVEKTPRILAAICGTVFVVMATYDDNGSAKESTTVPRPMATQLREAGDVILGTWKQYSYTPENAQWQYLGTFEVAKAQGSYTISAREQLESPTVFNSIGIFDVQSDGSVWKFNSNWGRGAVGNFDLRRISDTIFEGTISIEKQEVARTKWVRVQ